MSCWIHKWHSVGHPPDGYRHGADLYLCVKCGKRKILRYERRLTETEWATLRDEIIRNEADVREYIIKRSAS